MTRKQRSAAIGGLVLAAGLVLSVGCTNTGGSMAGPDPLVSSLTPRAAAPGSNTGVAAAPSGGVPGLPASTSATSPAALVSSTPPPGEPSRDLRAGDPQGLPVGKSSSWGPHGATVLGEPQQDSHSGGPYTPPVRLASGNTTAPAAVPAVSGGDTFERLMDDLHRRGTTWWRLEPMVSGGKYKFVCSVPNTDNHNSGIRYEATSMGDNGLGAIRAVLDQIDRERTNR